MPESKKPLSPVRFGQFEVDPQAGELRKHGRPIRLQDQPLQLLLLLLERPGQVVTREEARKGIWDNETFVDFDQGLNAALNRLRAALGDSASNPRFVETLPRRGYRFIAPVETTTEHSAGAVPVRASAAFRYVTLGFALVALLLGLAYLAQRRSPPFDMPGGEKTMLAVLPLENLDPDPEQEYFSDGLTEEIISQLGSLNPKELGVIARTSVMPYKETSKTIDEIGRELGVQYVLEGSVRREDDRVRITAQLIDVSDQTHVWAQSYDRELREIIALQSDVSKHIVRALALEVLPASGAASSGRSAVDPAAYEAYLKGLYFHDTLTEEGYRKGIEYFNQAVNLDPEYAPAYAGLAFGHGMLAAHGLGALAQSDAITKAKVAAQQALELNDSLAEAHAMMGMVHLNYDWDFEAAERSFRRAIELNSSYAEAYVWYSMFLEAMGRQADAVFEAERARELSPLSLAVNANLGLQLLQDGRYDDAVAQLEKSLELNPESWLMHWALGSCYRTRLEYGDALEAFERAVRFSGGSAIPLGSLGYTYAISGRLAEALRILNELNDRGQEMYVSPIFKAYIYAGLGETDEAFRWLEQAYQHRSRHLVRLAVTPELAPLRPYPRYRNLVDRIGLPQ